MSASINNIYQNEEKKTKKENLTFSGSAETKYPEYNTDKTELRFPVLAYYTLPFPVMRADLKEADESRKCSVKCPGLNES